MAKPKTKAPPKKAPPKKPAAVPVGRAENGQTYRRSDVARILGVTNTQVRRLQEAGDLRGTPDKDGIFRFKVDHVHQLRDLRAPKRGALDGTIAAKAYKLFDAGHDSGEVLIALELSPPHVVKLQENWRAMKKTGWWHDDDEVKEFGELGIKKAREILPTVYRLLSRIRELKRELDLARLPLPESQPEALHEPPVREAV